MAELREPSRAVLDHYRRPGVTSAAGRHAALLQALPDRLSDLVEAIQGLVIDEEVAADFCGVALPEARRTETHLRRVEAMLDAIVALDGRPLSMPRAADKRLVGVCHHPMLLLVAALRAKHIPARARCGFGAYFNPPYFEDHWVCEYWSTEQSRWVLVDAQLDDVWRHRLRIGFDPLDVPRSRFVIAADAWTACRHGVADALRYGNHRGNLRGLWFIAGNLMRDLAALNKVEVLPFDVWGAQPRPHEVPRTDRLALFEGLASLTREPDAAFDALRRIYEEDADLRVPATVFNALLQRQQPFA